MQIENPLTEESRLKERLKHLESRIVAQEQALLEQNNFGGHYHYWRDRRVTAIIEHFGPLWFQGKKILELACGYGDIGAAFATLGAQVTCSEVRPEHLRVINKRYSQIKTVPANLENEWPFKERFDLILNLGVLYHLKNFAFALAKSLESADHVVLETEVCDSEDPDRVIMIQESGYDQSYIGVGTRPSAACIERIMESHRASYERVSDNRCNALFHNYDWKVENTGRWCSGLRRFWFIKTSS